MFEVLISVPALIVKLPNEDVPLTRLSVPEPSFVKSNPPEIAPLKDKSTEDAPSLTVKTRLAIIETGAEIVGPDVPVPALFTVTFPPRDKIPDPVIEEAVAVPQYMVKPDGPVVVPKSKAANARVAPELMVNAPLTVGISTPNVVAPAEIVRLLKLVKTLEGKVFVAFIITVPVPGVQVFAPLPLPKVIAPFKVKVLFAVIVMVLVAAFVFPIVMLPAVMLDPLVKVIVP